MPRTIAADPKIFVKFAPNGTKEQFRSVLTGYTSLKPMDANAEDYFVEGYPSNAVVLVGKAISPEILNSLKYRTDIVAVTCLLEYNGVGLSAYSDEFTVKLKDGTSFTQLLELAEKYDCTTGKEDEFIKNQYMLHVAKTSEFDAMQTANLFYETGLFEFSEPNLIDFNVENSYDPYYSYQWGLNNTGQSAGSTSGIDINAEQAWTVTKGSSSIRIAIIDSGIDLTHPDLQANLLPGYDATGYGTAGGIYDIYDNHGTAVAGIAGAIQNNTYQGSFEGISGVAPGCKIVPVKASIGNSFDRTHSSAAINWVADYDKAEVINCSFGSHYAPTSNLTNAIKNAINKGCVVVCSSGNNSPFATVSYPANSDPRIIVVGAVDQTGARSIWNSSQASNYGAELDVVAPGTDVYTTDRQYIGYTSGSYYPSFGGTSAAAPHVAGVAALILSKNPNLTNQQVATIIESSAQKAGNYSYVTTPGHPYGTWNNQMGYGLVDAYMALIYTPTSTGYVNTPVISHELIRQPNSNLMTVVFSVDNPEPGVTYQWRLNNSTISNGGNPYIAFLSAFFYDGNPRLTQLDVTLRCRAIRNGTYSAWSNSIRHVVQSTTPIPYTP